MQYVHFLGQNHFKNKFRVPTRISSLEIRLSSGRQTAGTDWHLSFLRWCLPILSEKVWPATYTGGRMYQRKSRIIMNVYWHTSLIRKKTLKCWMCVLGTWEREQIWCLESKVSYGFQVQKRRRNDDDDDDDDDYGVVFWWRQSNWREKQTQQSTTKKGSMRDTTI